MGESKDEEDMNEIDSDVYVGCPFCGHVLLNNRVQRYLYKAEGNIYNCLRCKSEFERMDKGKLRVIRKGEKVYLKEGGYIWV